MSKFFPTPIWRSNPAEVFSDFPRSHTAKSNSTISLYLEYFFFVFEYKKLKFEILADFGEELCNDGSNAAS